MSSFLIPVGISPLQSDLIEILVKLHKNSIIEQHSDNPLSYNTTDDALKNQYLSTKDLNILFNRNLKAIQNHPYLIVEHFMPKQLLLMESHERLMIASDKFRAFDKLLTLLQNERLNLLISANNIKELDLIEAFILGRELDYKRYSGRKLHDVAEIVTTQVEKKLNKDTDEYIPKPKKEQQKSQLFLHLITTQQLYNASFQNIDAIISFDESLNEKESSIDYIRGLREAYVPLIKLVVLGSNIDTETTDGDFGFDFLVDRSKLNKNLESYHRPLGTNFQKIGEYFKELRELNGQKGNPKWPLDPLPVYKRHTSQDIILSLNDLEFIDDPEFTGSKKVKIEEVIIPEKLTLKDYKSILTKLAFERLATIEKKIIYNVSKLSSLRIKSTIKHDSEDQLKLKIAHSFRESKDLKEKATGAEKRHERIQTELDTFLQIEKDLHLKLENYSKEHNEEELISEIKELEALSESMRKQNEETDNELNGLRSSYQDITTQAAERSTLAKQLTTENEVIIKKLNNETAVKLRSLKNEETKLGQKDVIERLSKEVEFLQIYKSRLDQAIKEKGVNLNVGRNGRVHRSTTPYLAN